jgi:cytochrome c-type biogenesis protein CcmH/NrfG
MLSSKNIHFAILGIILGATSGYIFAFYQIDKNIPEKTRTLARNGDSQQAHPNVSNEQVLAMFKTQLEKNPKDVELLTRYGDFLSDIERFQEAADAYKKVLALEPQNVNAQTFMGTALWNLGKKSEAVVLYEKSIKADPNNVPTLYYLAMVDLDQNKNVDGAAQKLAKIEKIDPNQPALKELRQKIEDARKAK